MIFITKYSSHEYPNEQGSHYKIDITRDTPTTQCACCVRRGMCILYAILCSHTHVFVHVCHTLTHTLTHTHIHTHTHHFSTNYFCMVLFLSPLYLWAENRNRISIQLINRQHIVVMTNKFVGTISTCDLLHYTQVSPDKVGCSVTCQTLIQRLIQCVRYSLPSHTIPLCLQARKYTRLSRLFFNPLHLWAENKARISIYLITGQYIIVMTSEFVLCVGAISACDLQHYTQVSPDKVGCSVTCQTLVQCV